MGSALDWLARAKAQGALPDVVLMDLLMEPVGGLEATAAIKRLYPEVKVVAVTSFLDEDKVHAALEAGAAGYLLKDAEADEVAAAVRAAPAWGSSSRPGRCSPADSFATAGTLSGPRGVAHRA
jgi:DNA-binding NarL/FixJ family response regulator